MAEFHFYFGSSFYVCGTRKVAISLKFNGKWIQINCGAFFPDKNVTNGKSLSLFKVFSSVDG